ncbi:MAG TPA: ATP-binding domain-containing protein [Candidatus Eisenbacteria bacterium]|nr:ATP-binding domain-containing protein [Candidatus Eisenbacteria bacterium]
MPDPIVEEELRLLAEVSARLDATAPEHAPSETSLVKELEHLRDSIRDGGTKEEDRGALVHQFDRHSALLKQLRTAERAAAVDTASPYFAHLRLRENRAVQEILIGKTTRLLPGYPIVDWRNAPISRVFYRYRQGEEYEEEIAGRVKEGVVLARRTVSIRDRQLRRVDAPEGIFQTDDGTEGGWQRLEREPARLAGGQGSALRAHGADEIAARSLGTGGRGLRRRADKHLPDIAGLIDSTQFDLITKPSSGFVVIRGTAGSGKTTVALHRIAYLAYDDPRIDSPDTLFVVFSQALRDYVSHVLPALQVNRVQVRAFHEWASDVVRRLFPRLPHTIRDTTPAVVHRLKLHPVLMVALERHVHATPGKASARQVVDDWGSTLMNLTLLEEVVAAEAPGTFSSEELRRATDWCRVRHEELTAFLAGDDAVQAEIDEADEALLLYAWELRVGALPGRGERPLRYRHIAVDEVQDFAPIEVRVLLGCLDERKSITLAGDTQQAIVEHGGFRSWSEFLGRLGLDGTEVSTLEVSYRCTHEIASFAVALLGDLREDATPPKTVRSGPVIELFRFTDHGACVGWLSDALKELVAAEPLASVAILTPSAELSKLYFSGLQTSETPRLRLVEHQNFTFAPGIEVTEVEQVKGLEFDYVVVVEASSTSYPDTATSRRRLHVAATRAVHQLWLTSVGTPAVAVREQLTAQG